MHLAVDGRGLPLSIALLPGNVNDVTAFGQVPVTGRPRTPPARVLGDKAYSSWAIRHLLRRRGIIATIPERRDQMANRQRRGTRGGRPPAFDKGYRDRNVVERCFARLKQFRAIVTRFDKLADRYRAGIVLAALSAVGMPLLRVILGGAPSVAAMCGVRQVAACLCGLRRRR